MSGSIELVDGGFYWIQNRYGDHIGEWVVARWEHGCFWIGGSEASPRLIVGPIEPPTGSEASETRRATAPEGPPDVSECSGINPDSSKAPPL